MADESYGILKELVGTAGSIMAAGAAIGLAFRGRARWEPSEVDVSKGPQKVGGLAASVLIALLWALNGDPSDVPYLGHLALALLLGCVTSLCIYSFLVSLKTYYIEVPTSATAVKRRNIIGGFRTQGAANAAIQERGLTVQEFLRGCAYDPDKVWTPRSRALAKVVFVLCYLGLTVCGTVALAAAAIVVGLRVSGQ